jgi:hypothetical protein
MKGLSIIFTVSLLLLAHFLAKQLKRTGTLPAEQPARTHSLPSNPLSTGSPASHWSNTVRAL